MRRIAAGGGIIEAPAPPEGDMPNFAANLTMLFQEHDFLDRFKAATEAGFRGVEYLFPYGTWQTSATSSSPTILGGTNRARVR